MPVDISIGSSADGALTGADCDAPHRQGAKADLYRFFARAGQRVLIRMTAPAIDAYLMLTSGTGTMMAQDDDSAGALNAEIAVTMPATGTYVIEATSYSPDERGTYRIQVSSP